MNFAGAAPANKVALHSMHSTPTSLGQTGEVGMPVLTIRNIDAPLKERLRVRAARHGHSMEAEVRQILRDTLEEPKDRPKLNPYERIRALFDPLGGVDLELPPRELAREPPTFD